MRKIQTGDKVKVIAGKYKGTLGQITKVVKKIRPGKADQLRAAITNVPKIIKFKKKNVAYNLPGEQLEVDRLIDLSNVSLVTAGGNVSKVKFEIKNDKKIRVFKKTNDKVELNIIYKKSSLKLENDKALVTEKSEDTKVTKKAKK